MKAETQVETKVTTEVVLRMTLEEAQSLHVLVAKVSVHALAEDLEREDAELLTRRFGDDRRTIDWQIVHALDGIEWVRP